MTPYELIWYVGEPFREAIHRAVKLAKDHNQVVTVIDAASGKAIKRITPQTGFYETGRCK